MLVPIYIQKNRLKYKKEAKICKAGDSARLVGGWQEIQFLRRACEAILLILNWTV